MLIIICILNEISKIEAINLMQNKAFDWEKVNYYKKQTFIKSKYQEQFLKHFL